MKDGLDSWREEDVTKKCPFKNKVNKGKFKDILDSENRLEMNRLFGLAKNDISALFLEEGYRDLLPEERLGLISSLAINCFASFVRSADALADSASTSLDVRLLEWENYVLGLDSETPESLLMHEFDEHAPHASFPQKHIIAILTESEYTRPSSILLQAGFVALEEYLNDIESWPEDLIRFINVEASTHILEPRFGSIAALKDSGLTHRLQSAIRGLKVKIALKTKGVISFRVKIARNAPADDIYEIAKRPRMECALKRSTQLRYFVERELENSRSF